jgi:predicted alpha/beta superfamily hydrolase
MKKVFLDTFRKLIFLALYLGISVLYCTAQTTQHTGQLTVKSKILGEDRIILVHTPTNYERGNERFPVLYLTDAETHFEHTAATMEYLAQNGRMPKMIVVGIVNTDRPRDLTPTKGIVALPDGSNRFPTSGGANNFLKFIETELIPQIESKYRTATYRMFAGHSFGGLFALHVLLTRPELFNSYVAVSPSLQWDDQALLKQAERLFSQKKDWNKSLYISLGSEKGPIRTAFFRFRDVLTELKPTKLDWDWMQTDEEDHNSVVLPSHYAGFRRIFIDWKTAWDSGVNTTAENLSEADASYKRLSEKFGYTIEIPERVIFQIGMQLLFAGKKEAAIDIFKQWIQKYPVSSEAFAALADAYEKIKRLDLARENYQKAYLLSDETRFSRKKFFKSEVDRIAKILQTKT